jgi:hypothetical protein
MFTWFKRNAEFLGYEARQISANLYELVVRLADGTERVEQFDGQTALTERQLALQRELEEEGWTGPHGWNM